MWLASNARNRMSSVRDPRDDHPREPLPNMKFPHQSQLHQTFSRASFGIAVAQVPAGSSESRSRRTGSIIAIAAGHRSRAGVGGFLASSREVVFFVTNHWKFQQQTRNGKRYLKSLQSWLSRRRKKASTTSSGATRATPPVFSIYNT